MAKSDISDEQLDSIEMSRERWEQLTSYYAELMDRALSKPETGLLAPLNFMQIYDPNLDLVDDFAAFVKKLSTDPQVKNLFVSDVDRKYTPLGGNPNIGLREALIKNVGTFDPKFEDSYLKKFGFATDAILGDTDDESKLKAQELDINAPYFEGFDPQGEKVKEEELPEVTDWGNEEMGFGESKGDGTDSDKRQDKPPTGKADLLKKERDKQAALAGTDGPYGYRGGYEQFLKDQQILAPTALGKTEKDGSFRLRTPSEVQARIRQGQFNIQEPKREALRNFKNKFEGFQEQREQFIKDTGADPLQIEKFEKPNLFQKDARERQKREMLDKQFKVQEPVFGESPFLKDLSPTERAEVLRMVKEKEEKAFGKY
mgnify:CR=1 FL=1|tara:strand:- start:9358 stop:10473 length:1116 start_codon:yes stop_codon:yes gene_type:complete